MARGAPHFVACVTNAPQLFPMITCQVGLYFLSNSFLMKAAMSFSMLNFSRACVAQSTESCCMSSDMSAFLITACARAMQRACGSDLVCARARVPRGSKPQVRGAGRNSSRGLSEPRHGPRCPQPQPAAAPAAHLPVSHGGRGGALLLEEPTAGN